jgi:hypothetical protein
MDAGREVEMSTTIVQMVALALQLVQTPAIVNVDNKCSCGFEDTICRITKCSGIGSGSGSGGGSSSFRRRDELRDIDRAYRRNPDTTPALKNRNMQ